MGKIGIFKGFKGTGRKNISQTGCNTKKPKTADLLQVVWDYWLCYTPQKPVYTGGINVGFRPKADIYHGDPVWIPSSEYTTKDTVEGGGG